MILNGVDFEQTGVPRIFKTTQERLDSKDNTILSASYVAETAKSVVDDSQH